MQRTWYLRGRTCVTSFNGIATAIFHNNDGDRASQMNGKPGIGAREKTFRIRFEKTASLRGQIWTLHRLIECKILSWPDRDRFSSFPVKPAFWWIPRRCLDYAGRRTILNLICRKSVREAKWKTRHVLSMILLLRLNSAYVAWNVIFLRTSPVSSSTLFRGRA